MYLIQIILLIIIIIFLKYQYDKRKTYINDKKIKLVNKKMNRVQNNKPIFDIVFSPEYKYYNPETYIELIDYLESFLEIIELIKIDPSKTGDLYQNLLDNKRYIINLLLSTSIRLPSEFNIIDVTNNMDEILQTHLKDVDKIYEDYLRENGLNHTTKLILLNEPSGYNFDDNIVEPGKKLLFNRV